MRLIGIVLAYLGVVVLAGVLLEWDQLALQTVAVVAAGIVVIWYTWETALLRQESQRQTRLQLQPYVVFEPQGDGFVLRDIGNGAALNVRVEDVIISEESDIIVTVPGSVPVLPAGEKRRVEATSVVKGKGQGTFFVAHLDPKHASLEIEVTLVYQDIDGRPNSSTHLVRPGQLEIGGGSRDRES